MSKSDTKIAFKALEARAAASAGDDPLDRISLRDHVVEVEIGAFQQERGRRQRVSFNVVVEVLPLADAVEDDVDRILSYDTITEAISTALAAERMNLLETLAARIADLILAEPQAERVFVRIEKLDRGPGALGVEIVRSRSAGYGAPAAARPHPHPRVVFLPNAAIAAPGLADLVDDLSGDGAPVVLCVGLPDGAMPASAAPQAQRRIDLLAIEQNAWVLAGRDARFVVVETRTELDWAMKHGQITVWAPSKIVLDAVDGPDVSPRDPIGLVAWFAAELEAQELVLVDSPPPRGAVAVPMRQVQMTGGA